MSFDPIHKVIAAFVTGRIDQQEADRLLQETKRVNDGSLRVFFSDQRPHYQEAILKFFGKKVQPKRKGDRGRFPKPRLIPTENLLYAQVVKHRRKGRVVNLTEKIIFGTEDVLEAYLKLSSVSSKINTAFVERQNGTMRQHNSRSSRKTLAFSKEAYWMERHVHLCVGYYHFCLPHGSLREEISPPLPTKGTGSPKKWRQVTPAMSIGVTDHVWKLKEFLNFHVPPKIINNLTVKGH